jgi:mannan endo-1,4-beta-mannosidase
MKNILFSFWTTLLLGVATVMQAQKPGFYVNGRYLYDRCGEKVVLRGVNEMSVFIGSDPVGANYFPEIRKSGSNCVRIIWKMTDTQGKEANLDGLIQNCINNKMIPMIDLHDATGPYWNMLPQLVAYWTRPDILAIIKKHEKYLLVNIANELGDENVTEKMFVDGYKKAIQQMRAAGIHTPLVIDAQDWGKNLEMLDKTANTLLNSDADKNIMFSAHLYWPKKYGADDAFITNALQNAVNKGYCLIIGEFNGYGAWAGQGISVCSADGEINYQTILRECQKHEIGWLFWSWGAASNTGGGDKLCTIMDMTDGGLYSKLKAGFMTEIAVTSPYSIKNTSVVPKSILNGTCQSVAESYIKLKSNGLYVSDLPITAQKGTYKMDFDTNVPLKDLLIQSNASWLKTVTSPTGFAIEATANPKKLPRTAVITVIYRQKPTVKATLNVKQVGF